jgi:phosphate butyryltransferase
MIRENRTYDELKIGDQAVIKRVCSANDLYIFAHASGNLNPVHLPAVAGDGNLEAVAPSMWVGALVSAVLGNVLPGAGTLYRSQSFTFLDRVHVGDELTISVRVLEKLPGNLVSLETRVLGRGGEAIAEGVAVVLAPVRKQHFDERQAPSILVARHQHFDRLLASVRGVEPMATAVVAPEAAHALGGAVLAAQQGIIRPILVGRPALISAAAEAGGHDISALEIIAVGSTDEAAERAVALVHEGKVQALMKGQLHSDELLHHVVKSAGGLRTTRRLSHVFVMDVPGLDHLLFVSDAAINIAPNLEDKVDITQNAIDLALALGLERPKVGVLSAIETVSPRMPSSLDAAILSKMAERGQIRGGIVDGPLAMDNAMDMEAARTKGITSLVAGHAEILIVPNIEAGNMLAKELSFVAHAESAGIVLGARVPIILTSRADDEKSRLASCAVAVLYQAWKAAGR